MRTSFFKALILILLTGFLFSGCQQAMVSKSTQPEVKSVPKLKSKERKSVVFEDDFSESNNLWPERSKFVNKSECNFTIKNDNLVITYKNTHPIKILKSVDIDYYDYFEIGTILKQTKGNDKQLHGLVYGTFNINKYYNFVISRDGTYMIRNALTIIKQGKNSKAIKKHGPNELKIKGRGGKLSYYVNGTHLTTIKKHPVWKGKKVGLIASRQNYKIKPRMTVESDYFVARLYKKDDPVKRLQAERMKIIKRELGFLSKPKIDGFIICDDYLVLDPGTNLMWMRYNTSELDRKKKKKKTKEFNQTELKSWTEKKNREKLYGFNNWRIPLIHELKGLTRKSYQCRCRKGDFNGDKTVRKDYLISKAFHCLNTSWTGASWDWKIWAANKKDGKQGYVDFKYARSYYTDKGYYAARLVRTGYLDLIKLENFRLYGDNKLDNATRDKLNKTKKADLANLKPQAKMIFDSALKANAVGIFEDDSWYDGFMLNERRSELFRAVYKNKKDLPYFWLRYASFADIYLQPSLTLEALQQLEFLLEKKYSVPKELLPHYKKVVTIMKANAFMQMGKEDDAYGLLLMESPWNDEIALYQLNKSYHLLKDKNKLAAITGIGKSRLTGDYKFMQKYLRQQAFINLFTGEIIGGKSVKTSQNVKKTSSSSKGRVLD